jgi:hypothetical protein
MYSHVHYRYARPISMGKVGDFFGGREETQESREGRREKLDKVVWHVVAERRLPSDGLAKMLANCPAQAENLGQIANVRRYYPLKVYHLMV